MAARLGRKTWRLHIKGRQQASVQQAFEEAEVVAGFPTHARYSWLSTSLSEAQRLLAEHFGQTLPLSMELR